MESTLPVDNPTPSEAVCVVFVKMYCCARFKFQHIFKVSLSSAGYFDDMKKKVYGVYPIRTIIRHPAKRSEMPRNHILAN